MKRKDKLAIMRRSAGILVAATIGFLGLAAIGAYWAQEYLVSRANSPSTSAVLSQAKPTMTVRAYFGNTNLNPESIDCQAVFPVEREVVRTPAVARAALSELLSGPTLAERNGGYYTSINPGVAINSLSIVNGEAIVDLSAVLEQAVGGSCRVAAIRSQIEKTLMQFTSVRKVVISVDGRSEDILQP